MGTGRPRVFAVVAGCAVILAALVWWSFKGGRHSVRLADGRVVRLAAVTYGKQHRYHAGALWQKTLAPLLSTNLAKRLGIKTFNFTQDHESAMIWLEVADTNYTDLVVTTADSEDHESRLQFIEARAPIDPRRWLYGFELSSFPRRKESFRLKVYELRRSERELRAEFQVRNPARKDFPVWPVQSLPITNRIGQEEFILAQFDTGLTATGGEARLSKNWTEFGLQFGTRETAVGPWEPLSIELSDATGNFIQQNTPMQRVAANATVMEQARLLGTVRGRGVISLMGTLWNDEIWRIRVNYVRTQRSLFRPEETWLIKGAEVPAAGRTTEMHLRTNVAGETVFFESIRVSTIDSSTLVNANIHAALEHPTKGALLDLVKAIDNRGSNVWIAGPRPGISGSMFTLRRLSNEAKTVDLTFAVHRACNVEFVAKPTVVHTNIAKTMLWR